MSTGASTVFLRHAGRSATTISSAKLSEVDEGEVNVELSALSAWLCDNSNTELDIVALDAIRFNGPRRFFLGTRLSF